MNCPKCGKSMIVKETMFVPFDLFLLGFDKPIKFAVCNNFKDCDFNEEIILGEDHKYYSDIEAGN